MNWLYYLAEANIYLGVFYLAYCIFLSKETYYQLNRAYLLFSCVAAFVLPVLQLGALKPMENVVTATVNYTAADLANYTTHSASPKVIEPGLQVEDHIWYAYMAGVMVLFLILMVKLFTLYKVIRNKQRLTYNDHTLVYLPDSDVAFSFFNYLFIGTDARGVDTMIRHEMVHIRQKHSADILFLEVLKIINWFNPCIYLLQNSLKTVHEYIADERTAAKEFDALTYSSFLVNNAYGAGGSSLTHSFFNYNLLKKRITMLNQQRSGNLARLKYLLPVPICAALLCASTLAFSKTYGWVDLTPTKKALGTRSTVLPATIAVVNTEDGKRSKNIAPAPQKPPTKVVKFPPPVVTRKGALLVVNGRIYKGTEVGISADEGINIKDIEPNNAEALKIWGPQAKNGVSVITGKNIKLTPLSSIRSKSSKAKFPPPVIVKDPAPKAPLAKVGFSAVKTMDEASDEFYKEIMSRVKYPLIDRQNKVTGKVFISFMFGEDRKIAYAKVLRTPSTSLGEEVLRVIKDIPFNGYLKTGEAYTLPVQFYLEVDDAKAENHASGEPKVDLVYNPGSITPPDGKYALKMVVVRGYATK